MKTTMMMAILILGWTRLLEGASFLRGDCNMDGSVDISDPIRTLSSLFLEHDPAGFPCEDACDANDDGTIDIADPICTLDFLFRGQERLPAPHPHPGGDPTPDILGCGPADAADSDGDGLTDADEAGSCSDPFARDSDGDGTGDGEEVRSGRDPCRFDPPPHTVIVRDDDGTRESQAFTDLCDDWMEKRLMVPPGHRVLSARLHVLGLPAGTLNGSRSGRILVNHPFPGVKMEVCSGQALDRMLSFSPGDLFPSRTEYTWASVDIPPEWILPGENRFLISEGPTSSTNDWTKNNLYVGIDRKSDVDRSAWLENSITGTGSVLDPFQCEGELMIHLEAEVAAEAGVPDDLDLVHATGSVDVLPSPAIAEQPVTFRAIVSHASSREVKDLEVGFLLRLDDGSRREIVVRPHPILSPGRPAVFEATIAAPSFSFDLEAVIDPRGRQVERDVSNNTVRSRVDVEPCPRDLSVGILRVEPSLGRLDFTAEIRNKGLVDIPYVRWLVEVRDGVTGKVAWVHGGYIPQFPFDPPDIAKGVTKTLNMSLTYKPHTSEDARLLGISSGTYFLTATVFAEEANYQFQNPKPLPETDPANNSEKVYYEVGPVPPYPGTGHVEIAAIEPSPDRGSAGTFRGGYIWVHLQNLDPESFGQASVRLSYVPGNAPEAEPVSLGEATLVIHRQDPGSLVVRFDSRRFPPVDFVALHAEVLTGTDVIAEGAIDLPVESADVRIAGIRLQESRPITTEPLTFRVLLENRGTESVEADLRMLVDARFAASRRVEIPAKGETAAMFTWEACPEGSSPLCGREAARSYRFTFEIQGLPDFAAQSSVSQALDLDVQRPPDLYLGHIEVIPEHVAIGEAAMICAHVRDLAATGIPYEVAAYQITSAGPVFLGKQTRKGAALEEVPFFTDLFTRAGKHEVAIWLNGTERGRATVSVDPRTITGLRTYSKSLEGAREGTHCGIGPDGQVCMWTDADVILAGHSKSHAEAADNLEFSLDDGSGSPRELEVDLILEVEFAGIIDRNSFGTAVAWYGARVDAGIAGEDGSFLRREPLWTKFHVPGVWEYASGVVGSPYIVPVKLLLTAYDISRCHTSVNRKGQVVIEGLKLTAGRTYEASLGLIVEVEAAATGLGTAHAFADFLGHQPLDCGGRRWGISLHSLRARLHDGP